MELLRIGGSHLLLFVDNPSSSNFLVDRDHQRHTMAFHPREDGWLYDAYQDKLFGRCPSLTSKLRLVTAI